MENKYLINELYNCTNKFCNLLKMQTAQEEIYFLPVGILFMKWINDSQYRLNWNVPGELKNLFQNEILYNNMAFNKYIYDIAEKLEKRNPILNKVFTSLCFPFIDYIDKEQLKNIFRVYSEFQFDDNNSEEDITGPFMELFLNKLSNDSDSYEFITPKSIRQILVKLFKIDKNMNIADIVCGTGGILSEIINEYRNNSAYGNTINFYGQDINLKVSIIARINLLLHGIKNPNITTMDTLKERVKYKDIDIVLSNLPLGVNWNINEIGYREDIKYGFPNNKAYADWLFIQRGIACLNSNGKAAFIVSKGTLTRNNEIDIRKRILADDIIEAVISLPNNLYGPKTMPIEILVINKQKEKKRKNKILFIDASEDYYTKERGKNDLDNNHINNIIDVYNNWIEVDKYSRIIENSTIEKYNFELDSSLFINYEQMSRENMKMKKLKNVANVKRGLQLNKNDVDKITNSQDGTHYYIKICDMIDGKIKFNEKIKDLSDDKIASYELRTGDIIISARGTLIKTAIYERNYPPSIISGNIMLIRVKSGYNPYFLKFYLDSSKGKEEIQIMQGGATITALNQSKLQELLVPDIDLEKQNKFAERIRQNEESYESIIENATKKYEKNIEVINKEIFNFINK